MIPEQRLAQLRFMAAHNGYTADRVAKLQAAGKDADYTPEANGPMVAITVNELQQFLAEYDRGQA